MYQRTNSGAAQKTPENPGFFATRQAGGLSPAIVSIHTVKERCAQSADGSPAHCAGRFK
jgi:hypothetical protein